MSIIGFLTELITPISRIIDKFTSDKERLEAQAAILRLEVQLSERMLGYETRLMEAQARAIAAEAQGNGWLQRNWRPVTMLVFLALVVLDSVDWLPNRLAPQAWTLLQIGLGGYVAGRSLEKVAPRVTEALSRKDKD
ncbi:3TM-type holin [Desulfocurvibacter africanus]|uniref:3TM-type holin n=1 Tax=Desulfocurvibacter africanus TaxID=873 RepID=UPI00041B5DC2|nr:3TM-type holin [Desulfocurvibacter africanus]